MFCLSEVQCYLVIAMYHVTSMQEKKTLDFIVDAFFWQEVSFCWLSFINHAAFPINKKLLTLLINMEK